jgi:hypothetical protein
MTDENQATPPAQAAAASAGAPYQSLASLRDAHSALRNPTSASADQPGLPGREQQIRAFLIGASRAGAFISDAKERRVAQSILDFWSADLASSAKTQSDELGSVLLAPFDAAQAPRGSNQPAPAISKDQRELIRLSAYARQYVDSDRQAGYLLTGETIQNAARFKDQDRNIAELVTASEAAAGRRKLFNIVSGTLATLVVTVVALYFALLSFNILADRIYTIITKNMAEGKGSSAFALRVLDFLQPWRPPYDLSGTPEFAKLKLPGLRLYAPNFTGVGFSNVSFPAATLPAASFTESTFTFDGSGYNDFGGAELRQAQFRRAKIAFTSFRGADLYRAVFDRATLCDVDFSEANLRSASFWATTFDPTTKKNLENAAWWLAVGWPWSVIEQLAPPSAGGADEQTVRQNKARLDVLEHSPGFKQDIAEPNNAFQRTSAGTLERARALNDVAWIYAVWGLHMPEPGSAPLPDPCAAEGFPNNARDAAAQAVCIVTKLNADGDKKGAYTDFLANLKDTLAYVLMQIGDMPKAVETFKEIAKDSPAFIESADTSFRYAIAQYAVTKGGQDAAVNDARAAAVKTFESAIYEKRYQPTHELQTLKDYIFPIKEFVSPLKESTDRLWPQVKYQFGSKPNAAADNGADCPPRKSENAR